MQFGFIEVDGINRHEQDRKQQRNGCVVFISDPVRALAVPRFGFSNITSNNNAGESPERRSSGGANSSHADVN